MKLKNNIIFYETNLDILAFCVSGGILQSNWESLKGRTTKEIKWAQ